MKRSTETALLEKYDRFLVNHFKQGISPSHLDLTAEGWKLLVRENLTPMIEDRLQMRQIYTHIFELPPDFYDSGHVSVWKKKKSRDKTIVSRYNIDVKNLEKGLAGKIKQHQEVFCHLLPLMREYYQSTASYEGILERIDQNMENSYYRFINSDNLIAQAFIEKRMGLREKALHDFEAIPFSDENIKNEYLKKFDQCEE